MYGSFNQDALDLWDFTRCQRANGTFYGTRGKCRQGDEVDALAVPKPKSKKAAGPKKPKSTRAKRGKSALASASPQQIEKLKKDPRVTPAQKKVLDKAKGPEGQAGAPEKRKRRTKAEMEAARKEERRVKREEAKAKKAQGGVKPANVSKRGQKALEKASPEQLEKLKNNPRVTPEQKAVLDKAIEKKRGMGDEQKRRVKEIANQELSKAKANIKDMGLSKAWAKDEFDDAKNRIKKRLEEEGLSNKKGEEKGSRMQREITVNKNKRGVDENVWKERDIKKVDKIMKQWQTEQGLSAVTDAHDRMHILTQSYMKRGAQALGKREGTKYGVSDVEETMVYLATQAANMRQARATGRSKGQDTRDPTDPKQMDSILKHVEKVNKTLSDGREPPERRDARWKKAERQVRAQWKLLQQRPDFDDFLDQLNWANEQPI